MDTNLSCASLTVLLLLLFYFFLLTFSRPHRIEFKEQSCLSNLSCVCFSCFCVVLGFALRCIKLEWVQTGIQTAGCNDTKQTPQRYKRIVFSRLCEKRFLSSFSGLNNQLDPRGLFQPKQFCDPKASSGSLKNSKVPNNFV